MVSVMMGVHQMRHGVTHPVRRGDLVHRPLQVPPIDGGASNSTTPSLVARNADWYTPSVTQYKFRSTRPA